MWRGHEQEWTDQEECIGEIRRAMNKQLMWAGVKTQDRKARGWTGCGDHGF